METQVFINIPTTDLERSTAFYAALGWTINPAFTDDNAACVVISDTIYLMVLTRDFFATFTTKPIVDPSKMAQVQIALSAETRDEVDAFLDKVIAAGGPEVGEAQDYGFMYSRDFEDPDGNHFGMLWMDPVASEIGPEAFMAQQAKSS